MKGPRRVLRALAVTSALALVIGSSLALAACGDDEGAAAQTSAPTKDVATTLADQADLSSYAAAVSAAGLAETLAGEGPYTVFAPSDDAVQAAGVSLDDAYATVPIVEGLGLTKADCAAGAKNASLLADNDIVTYTGSDGALYVDSIRVSSGPIECSNGMIYVIDGVIAPKD